MYQPKIITGKVTGTGWSIDGHVLTLSQWSYDNYSSWHLWAWDDADDEAVMQTMFDSMRDAGLIDADEWDMFRVEWENGEFEPPGSFCIDLDKVEVLEVVQEEEEEEKDGTQRKSAGSGFWSAADMLRAHGFDIRPREDTDKGGLMCMPLEKNLPGDCKEKHPDWKLVKCPRCGRDCWYRPEFDFYIKTQNVAMCCTECALAATTDKLPPYQPKYTPNITPKPGGNRAQRRRDKRHGRR